MKPSLIKTKVPLQRTLGVVNPASGLQGAVLNRNGKVYDVMLCLVDVSKNMDKYYSLQIVNTLAGFYASFHWGRTGTTGQTSTEGPFDEATAIQAFKAKFTEKTGNDFDQATFSRVADKYDMLKVNYTHDATGVRWEYYVDDSVDGKATGWHPYTKEGNDNMELLYKAHLSNPSYCQRCVHSGMYVYLVDLTKMQQTNTQHPAHKTRNIRRSAPETGTKPATPHLV
jgi:predicted DNA-binding WGR domain protein